MTFNTDVLIIGAGYAGSVVAEQLATAGKNVLIIDKRNHVGGNAYDELDKQGVLVHRYGPHIFHTNAQRIFDYLSHFTKWRPYEHKVLAKVGEQLLPIPINQDTINLLYGLNLDDEGTKAFFEKVRQPRHQIITSEDVVLNSVGPDLCDKFFRGYTRKQWGLDLSDLSAGVAARIPTRINREDRYFTDKYQAMPLYGYTKMFERMLKHPKIKLELGVDFMFRRDNIKAKAKYIVYTGPIDAYFNHCFGKLPYRSLQFKHEHLANTQQFQPVGTINYPNDYDYTRITEFKHLTGQQAIGTSIVREYPQAEGDPYYPIPRQENEILYKKYEELANQEKNVSFVGRLAQYKYYNMDQVVGAALKEAKRILILGEM
jgi:UDP-galactopyranose mutase